MKMKKLVRNFVAALYHPVVLRSMSTSSIPTLSSEQALAALREKRQGRGGAGLHAFYSSWVGGIVKDPSLMVLPMDDHMVHRGHGVFDTATLADGKLYRLYAHLDRFLGSAERARIDPLPLSREGMVDAIKATVAASGKREAAVRYWLSAGPGDFSFSPKGCEPCFYCMVFEPFAMGFDGGVSERSVGPDLVPMKPPLLAGCKSNNYLLNVLTHLASADEGGVFGIQVDAEGYVAEGAVVNAAFVLQDGTFVTPPFDKILRGCTVRRAMELAPRLVEEGLLTRVEQRPIKVAEAKGAREAMLMGGDTHLVPVVRWDGDAVGTGEVGPVMRRLLALLEADVLESFDCEVEYGD